MSLFTKLFGLGMCASVLTVVAGCDSKANKAGLEVKASPDAGQPGAKTASSDLSTTALPIRTQLAELTTTGMEYIRLTGTLSPDERSQVAARVSGIVMDVPVDRGAMVKRGDVLAHLDPIDAKNALEEGEALAEEIRVRLGMEPGQKEFKPENQPEVQQAMTKYELERTNYQRIASLQQQGVLPQSDADKAISEFKTSEQAYNQAVAEAKRLYQSYTSAQIRLRALNKNVEDTTVTAPYDGMVSEKLANVGERLSATSGNVVTLVRIDPIRLFLTVSERDLPFIKVGDTLDFTVSSFPDRIFKSTVARVSPELDIKTRALVVECAAPNKDGILLPGMFAIARLPLHGKRLPPLGATAFDELSTGSDAPAK